ncbi:MULTISPECIES: ATP-grasp domain-containing protein [unclassified Streptomyces]|uniref:ATP-grasp domain-containing protein n=1 Tax=unclassified Streptomyces TaxID=2593676 RepID=UPI000DBA3729|nr:MULTISPECIES: ATP-grasp domain-containing protein [unclassified Streptomyces]MYT68254.1 ATP-grasp domain-containing protein [Streptomyces sp. SID8367]RAJ76886.1 argininosuccinate lyase [Streptomyces sp. PsTaAH-137]
MSEPYLLLVESNTSGTGPLFAQRARERGVRPVLLADDPGRYAYARADGITVVEADTSAAGPVLAAVDALGAGPPAGVTTSSDYFVPVAAEVAHALGLPGPDPAAAVRCRHKGHQHDTLAAAGVPVAGHVLATDADAAARAVQRFGPPVILKPADGSGSTGVRLCADAEEAAAHAALLLARTHNERGIPTEPGLLVEEYVDGPEFSVEVFGRTPVAVVGKHLGAAPYFVETGHDVPAAVPAGTARLLARTAVAAVDALGLGHGAAHVELRLAGRGPVVIEVNPRLAGGMIPELVRAAHGIDLVDAQVGAALGDRPDLEHRHALHSSLRFLVVEEPSVLADPPAEPSTDPASPYVTARVLTGRRGVPLVPHHDHRDRVGHAVATAPDGPTAARAAAQALDLLRAGLRTGSVPRSTI